MSLEKLYNGEKIKVKYEKNIINPDGITLTKKNCEKEIIIPKGFDPLDNPIVFKQEGNELPGFKSSNLIVSITQVQNVNFLRKGMDLFYTKELTLLEALMAKPFQIQSINGRDLLVPVTDIINPQSVIKLTGEGMVNDQGSKTERGNLYIKFHITFPEFISLDDKNILSSIL